MRSEIYSMDSVAPRGRRVQWLLGWPRKNTDECPVLESFGFLLDLLTTKGDSSASSVLEGLTRTATTTFAILQDVPTLPLPLLSASQPILYESVLYQFFSPPCGLTAPPPRSPLGIPSGTWGRSSGPAGDPQRGSGGKVSCWL